MPQEDDAVPRNAAEGEEERKMQSVTWDVMMDDPVLGVKSSTSAFVMINVGKGMIMTKEAWHARTQSRINGHKLCTAHELGAIILQ